MYFNGCIYRQVKGTAMGTKVAPCYANLTMAYLEDKMVQDLRKTLPPDIIERILEDLDRYLDDLFIIWCGSEEHFNILYDKMNTMDKDIKFTISIDSDKLPFLDVLVLKKGRSITTDIYSKATDTKQYLTFNSCHPRHIKINLPYSLARRIVYIVSDEEIRKIRFKELGTTLQKRGYPPAIIKDAIKRAENLDRSSLLNNQKTTKEKDVIPYVTTYNPNNPNIFPAIINNTAILKNDERMEKILKRKTIINSKRQPRNLKSILTSSRFDRDSFPSQKVQTCGDKRCKCCQHMCTDGLIKYKGKEIGPRNVQQPLTCASKNVLYAIICDGCKEIYIGQTGDVLRSRVRVHRQQINDPSVRMLPVSGHLEKCGKKQFKILPFYKFQEDDVTNRTVMEKHFINIFKPGLNK